MWMKLRRGHVCMWGGVADPQWKQSTGRYVLPRFSKVGCPELIFLYLKFWSPEQSFVKIDVSGAEIKPKSTKIGFESAFFFQKK